MQGLRELMGEANQLEYQMRNLNLTLVDLKNLRHLIVDSAQRDKINFFEAAVSFNVINNLANHITNSTINLEK
jgi:hypothetical protein